jgi:hypothetical protein
LAGKLEEVSVVTNGIDVDVDGETDAMDKLVDVLVVRIDGVVVDVDVGETEVVVEDVFGLSSVVLVVVVEEATGGV